MAPKCTEDSTNITITAETDLPAEELEKKKEQDESTINQQKNIVLKNMAILCLGFWCSFAAFNGITYLQNTINNEDNLGHRSLSLMFICPLISSLLLPSIVISKIGLKWCMVFGLLAHGTFVLANLHPKWYTMYPSAIVTGISGGIIWSAHNTYIVKLGKRYSELTGESSEVTIHKFFGAYFVCHRLSNVVGSLLSSTVLKRPDSAQHLHPLVIKNICGASYCHQDLHSFITNSSSLMQHREEFADHLSGANYTSGIDDEAVWSMYRPSPFQMYLLLSIFSFFALLAPILMSFVQPIKNDDEDQSENVKHKTLSKLMATAKMLINIKIMLLMPLIFFSGTWMAFVLGYYTLSFPACILGIDYIGYAMATFGGMAAITSVACGYAIKYTGRQLLLTLGAVCSIVTAMGLLSWTPDPQTPVVLFSFSALMGMCITIFTNTMMGFTGFIFKDQSPVAAFASFNTLFHSSIGMWFILSKFMCVYTQLKLMVIFLIIGMTAYGCDEMIVHHQSKKITNEDKSTKL